MDKMCTGFNKKFLVRKTNLEYNNLKSSEKKSASSFPSVNPHQEPSLYYINDIDSEKYNQRTAYVVKFTYSKHKCITYSL